MLLGTLVETAGRVAATASRTEKIRLLSEMLSQLDSDLVPAAVGFLAGNPLQGKIGLGWAGLSKLETTGATTPSLSVADLDRALSELQRTTGPKSQSLRNELLSRLFSLATPPEADFIKRLLLGELRQGALAGVMAEAIAKAAAVPSDLVRRASMLSGDLRKAASVALSSGESGLRAIGLEIFCPVLPMLASTSDDVGSALAETGAAAVEWKLDGIRIQVHRRGEEVRIYTRNLNDITSRVPEVVQSVRSLAAFTLVLDGEAIVLDEHQRPHMFQETMSRMGRQAPPPATSAAAYFFDLLHIDGEDLIDLPLEQRIERLELLAPHLRIPSTRTTDPAEASAVLDRAIDAGHEGVMIKSLASQYQAGRRGKLWRKVKPVATLDLVVIGVEWGHGRRSGFLSNLHLGARGPAETFVMVGKTFKGLTDELLRWQTETFLALETHRQGITVFVRPEVVVEIALDGVQSSTRYPGGVALRFARVKRYRPDKSPAESDTIEAVRSLLSRNEEN